jgi:hypothetical protein
MSPLINNPLDNWDTLSDRELISRGLEMGHTQDQPAMDRLLQVRFSERAGQENEKLVTSTNKLVQATHRLGTVTWWLVGGTILLGLAAATDVVMKLIKGVH